jgi:acetylornithine/succinyldiaminopimelate/putrescine aminotransferase
MLPSRLSSAFYKHVAQTSPFPIGLEIAEAKGLYLFDTFGNKYLDLISGISVSNIGHRHSKVVKAIQEQTEKYMHTMVYGEFIQSPQVLLAEKLSEILNNGIDSFYFVNSGSEATEGAIKLSRKATGRKKILAFKNAYHGSTTGALSLMDAEWIKEGYGPLLPDIEFISYNNFNELNRIDNDTAAVFTEAIQGEAGVLLPAEGFLKALREKCTSTGALLVLDEIQTGFGRTGNWFYHQQEKITPDILLIAKGMGGGMPIGAFCSSRNLMLTLSHDPVLGHITTFGGHPVNCAAALATIQVIEEEGLVEQTKSTGQFLQRILQENFSKDFRCCGLLAGIQFQTQEEILNICKTVLHKGILTDWFLHNPSALRIAPPLTIDIETLSNAVQTIKNVPSY